MQKAFLGETALLMNPEGLVTHVDEEHRKQQEQKQRNVKCMNKRIWHTCIINSS
jgi:hypothetical protein